METRTAGDHLTDGELFALALPPAGEPEAAEADAEPERETAPEAEAPAAERAAEDPE